MLIHGPRAVTTPRVLSILLLFLSSASSSRGDQAALEARIAALTVEELADLVSKADSGNTEAQYLLGRSYHLGQAQAKDPAAALSWYTKAAEQGHALGAFRLSEMYRDGEGTPQDLGLAEEWLSEAGQHGHGPSLVASLYLLGLGVVPSDEDAQDLGLADDWLSKAALLGHARAQFAVGRIAEGRSRLAEALQWYRQAADQGLAEAQNALGFFYERGYGLKRDYKQAASWYRKAAEQGSAMAQDNLGVLYREGRGVAKDHRQATAWFRLSAERGWVVGQVNLAIAYALGQGVRRDLVNAYMWCSLALLRAPSELPRHEYQQLLDSIGSQMKPDQLLEARTRAIAWLNDHATEDPKARAAGARLADHQKPQ